MSEKTALLPEKFRDMEPYARVWGELQNQEERYLQRQSSSMEDLKAYYDCVAPRLNEVFDYLETFPKDNLPEAEARLNRTVLGLCEVAMAVEIFKQPRMPYAPFPHDVKISWTDYPPE